MYKQITYCDDWLRLTCRGQGLQNDATLQMIELGNIKRLNLVSGCNSDPHNQISQTWWSFLNPLGF